MVSTSKRFSLLTLHLPASPIGLLFSSHFLTFLIFHGILTSCTFAWLNWCFLEVFWKFFVQVNGTVYQYEPTNRNVFYEEISFIGSRLLYRAWCSCNFCVGIDKHVYGEALKPKTGFAQMPVKL